MSRTLPGTRLPTSSTELRDSETFRALTETSMQSPEAQERFKAKLTFMKTFRHFHTAASRSKYLNKKTPQLEYLKEINRQKLVPESTVFCGKSSPRQLNFQEFSLGDQYATAISVAISRSPTAESLNFKNNRLGETGSLKIIETLRNASRIKEVNLSENKLGTQSVTALANILKSKRCGIESLSLEHALYQREHVDLLLEALSGNQHLRLLNLARNNVSATNSKALYQFLSKNTALETLDLHWNTLRGPAAVQLFLGLSGNAYIKVLDLSWNSLGRDHDLDVCSAICRMFKDNYVLLHLDLSNNYLTFAECEALSEGIRTNHTLLGIHMEGNDCEVDALGFLRPVEDKRKDIESHMSPRLLTHRSARVSSKNCWVCHKWQEATFAWNIEEISWNRRQKHIAEQHKASTEPVFLHLDLDDYQPFLLEKQSAGSYLASRAIPPTGAKFFFTYRGIAQVSTAYQIFIPQENLVKTVQLFTGTMKTFTIVVLNVLTPFGRVCSTKEDFSIEPRPAQWRYDFSLIGGAPIIPEWSVETSVFKAYKLDTEALMQECLEYDLEHTKISSLFKSSEEFLEIKSILMPVYKTM